MRVAVFSAHPDDAEMTVGGSICRYTDGGHQVHVVNLTNNHTQRVACAERSSKTMACSCEFMDFADIGEAGLEDPRSHLGVCFDPVHLAAITAKLRELQPDLIWTHWPVDTHPDHIATGSLVLRAWDNLVLRGESAASLWFFGPAYGYQSLCFQPDHYEDITDFMARKKQAVGEYECVDIWACWPIQETTDIYHGYAAGCKYAEGFVRSHARRGAARYDVVP